MADFFVEVADLAKLFEPVEEEVAEVPLLGEAETAILFEHSDVAVRVVQVEKMACYSAAVDLYSDYRVSSDFHKATLSFRSFIGTMLKQTVDFSDLLVELSLPEHIP